MSKIQQAVDTFLSGFNCSQAILRTYGPDYGLPPLECLRVSCGFGGGMRRSEVCGAVTGALMVIGLRFGPEDTTDTSKDEAYSKVSDFSATFEKRCGSIICRDLMGCDLSTPEGISYATEKDLFKTVCPEVVKVAAEILEDMCPPVAPGDPLNTRP